MHNFDYIDLWIYLRSHRLGKSGNENLSRKFKLVRKDLEKLWKDMKEL